MCEIGRHGTELAKGVEGGEVVDGGINGES
jgi:hypothetical protein